MVAYLSKSDASKGFNQIIDFLNGSSIKYALTVNHNIYVSCIKQFWTTVADKKVNDVTRLQALVDKKKVVVTKATIREALRFDDADGVECPPNEEIFAELARMGYEKPSTKLTLYKAFFSSHLVRNVDSPTKFYMYPRFLQLVIRKQVGNLLTHTTKYTSPALTSQEFEQGDANENVENVNAGDAAEGDVSAANDEGRMINDMDVDADVVLEEAKEVAANAKANQYNKEEESEPVELQEVVDIVTTAKIITKVVTATSTIITAAEVPVPATTTTTAPKLTDAPSRRTKGVVIRDSKESFTTISTIIHYEAKSKDNGKGILTKEKIEEEESRALKRINETPAEKAAKRRKLNEEVEELKRHLQMVPNEDDDVYTEATLLARKMLNVVRLEIEEESEVSFELLRFIQQQHQEGAQLE
nr:hypothetical protein [Tanacetum cinerariifolium]